MTLRRLSLAAALTMLALAGCREHKFREYPPAPLTYEATAFGTPVHYPTWMTYQERHEAEIAINQAGVPDGWAVEVQVPWFPNPYDAYDVLVNGTAIPEYRRIVVGIRVDPSDTILPELAREVDHARTLDRGAVAAAGGEAGTTGY